MIYHNLLFQNNSHHTFERIVYFLKGFFLLISCLFSFDEFNGPISPSEYFLKQNLSMLLETIFPPSETHVSIVLLSCTFHIFKIISFQESIKVYHPHGRNYIASMI